MSSTPIIAKSTPSVYESVPPTPDTPDEPPPLPCSAPPPIPHWSFPAESQSSVDMPPQKSTIDTPLNHPSMHSSTVEMSRDKPVIEKMNTPAASSSQDVTTLRIRMETLQRKAEFLGLNPKELEELKKLESGRCTVTSVWMFGSLS